MIRKELLVYFCILDVGVSAFCNFEYLNIHVGKNDRNAGIRTTISLCEIVVSPELYCTLGVSLSLRFSLHRYLLFPRARDRRAVPIRTSFGTLRNSEILSR